MHDPQYRMQVSSEQAGFNQPPHPSFHIGHNMQVPPKPDIFLRATWGARRPAGRKAGAPGGNRTPSPRLRRPMLYPLELRAQTKQFQRIRLGYPSVWKDPAQGGDLLVGGVSSANQAMGKRRSAPRKGKRRLPKARMATPFLRPPRTSRLSGLGSLLSWPFSSWWRSTSRRSIPRWRAVIAVNSRRRRSPAAFPIRRAIRFSHSWPVFSPRFRSGTRLPGA